MSKKGKDWAPEFWNADYAITQNIARILKDYRDNAVITKDEFVELNSFIDYFDAFEPWDAKLDDAKVAEFRKMWKKLGRKMFGYWV